MQLESSGVPSSSPAEAADHVAVSFVSAALGEPEVESISVRLDSRDAIRDRVREPHLRRPRTPAEESRVLARLGICKSGDGVRCRRTSSEDSGSCGSRRSNAGGLIAPAAGCRASDLRAPSRRADQPALGWSEADDRARLGCSDARRGFTILELLVVLLIASLAATAAIPAYFARSEVTLDNATRLLVDDLRQAQIRAVYRSAPVEVRFEPDGDGYAVLDRGTNELAPSHGTTELGRRYSQDAVFEGVRLVAVELGAESSLTFDADGTTSQGGRITIGYRGDARTVSIETGRGTIQAPELETCALHGRP